MNQLGKYQRKSMIATPVPVVAINPRLYKLNMLVKRENIE